jgi:site-specific DNA recombinase
MMATGNVKHGQRVRAGIYCRISMDRAGTLLGVERQAPPCRELCERNGWEVAGVYVDNDVSASNGKRRPEYERLLQDLKDGTLGAVVALHNDRLHRSPLELEAFINVVEAQRAHVATVQGGVYDLCTPTGRMQARIVCAVARQEVEHKGERQVLSNQQRAAAGKAHGGPRCYGYDGMRLRTSYDLCLLASRSEVHVDEPELIRQAASRILAGESVRSVTRDLNDRGIPSAEGGRWSQRVLSRLLMNPRIAGLCTYKGEITAKGAWPPVLDEERWRRLAAVLKSPDRAGRQYNVTREGTTSTYLLLNLLRCGKCGHALAGRPRADRTRSYLCPSPAEGGCAGTRVVADAVERHVEGAVVARLNSPEMVATIRRRQQTGDVGGAVREVERLSAKLDNLSAMHADDELTFSEWQTQRRIIEPKLRAARAAVERLERSSQQAALLDAPELARRWNELPFDRRRTIVRSMLDRIVVSPADPHGPRRFDPARLSPDWKL